MIEIESNTVNTFCINWEQSILKNTSNYVFQLHILTTAYWDDSNIDILILFKYELLLP